MTIRIGGEKASKPELHTPPVMPPHRPRKKRMSARLYTIGFGFLLLSVILFGAYALYEKFSGTSATTPGTQNSQAADNTSQVVSRVGNMMLLPDETPTIATVTDLSKLQGQKFFAHAEKGDIVLMYAKAQKAILYSPSQNKIIEVAPITNDKP